MRLLLLALVACSGGKPPVPVEPHPTVEPEPVAVEPETPADPGPPSVMPDPAPSPDPFGDAYSVMAEPTLKGLVLTVDVRYGGGCREHVFSPRGGPRVDGQQTWQTIVLHHDAAGDTCRALKYETLTFDLGDNLDADCLTKIRLLVPASEDAKGEYLLPVTPPQGCD